MARSTCWRLAIGILMALGIRPMAAAQNEFLFEGTSVEWDFGALAAVADIDLDGRPDIITQGNAFIEGEFEYGLDVRLALPDGTYGAPSFLPDAVYFVHVLELTSDSWPDLLALSYDGTELLVLPGIGGGEFGAPIASAVELPVEGFGGLVLADVDDDGFTDAGLAHYTNNQGCKCIDFYLGHGDGSFSPGPSTVMGPKLGDPIAEDFDGDGHLDLFATINPESPFGTDKLLVATGDGSGSFAPPILTELGVRAGNVIPIDWNRDGRLDLVTGTWVDGVWASVTLLENVDGTSFTAKPAIELQRGGELFTPSSAPVTVRLADLDEDGHLDMVAAVSSDFFVEETNGALYFLKGLGGFDFAPPIEIDVAGDPVDISLVDIDLDGHLDAVVPSYAGAIAILHGRGDGGFELGAQVPVESPAVDIASGDVNGDGYVDLAVARAGAGPSLSIRLGAGDGSFVPGVDLQQPGFVQRVLLSDATGDGTLDLVVGTMIAGRTVQLLEGLGDGTFRAPSIIGGEPVADVHVADLDGDGVLDILTCDPQPGLVSVHRGLGQGLFAPQVAYASGGPSRRLSTGDFDEDGRIDVIVANPDVQAGDAGEWTLATLPGLAGGALGAPVLHNAFGTQDVAVADMDLDGHQDAVLARFYYYESGTLGLTSTYSIVLRRGHGDGTFGTWEHISGAFLSPTVMVPWRVEVADMNRDGRLDVVTSSPPSEAFLPTEPDVDRETLVGLALQHPGITFYDAVGIQASAAPLATTVADFDEDGFPDIAAVQANADSVGIWLNRSNDWATLGYALPAMKGGATPLLVGSGTPAADEQVALEASGGALGDGSPGALIVGVEAQFAPFHGGLLVPSVDVLVPVQSGVSINGRWPKGVPAGMPVYLQAVFAPPGGEVVASNALVVLAQ